jgi:hypothetical protein
MRKYIENEVIKIEKSLDYVVCDKCGVSEGDIMKFQEWLYITFTGGYYSIFGDGNTYACDLCQKCTKEVLGDYLTFIKFDWQ